MKAGLSTMSSFISMIRQYVLQRHSGTPIYIRNFIKHALICAYIPVFCATIAAVYDFYRYYVRRLLVGASVYDFNFLRAYLSRSVAVPLTPNCLGLGGLYETYPERLSWTGYILNNACRGTFAGNHGSLWSISATLLPLLCAWLFLGAVICFAIYTMYYVLQVLFNSMAWSEVRNWLKTQVPDLWQTESEPVLAHSVPPSCEANAGPQVTVLSISAITSTSTPPILHKQEIIHSSPLSNIPISSIHTVPQSPVFAQTEIQLYRPSDTTSSEATQTSPSLGPSPAEATKPVLRLTPAFTSIATSPMEDNQMIIRRTRFSQPAIISVSTSPVLLTSLIASNYRHESSAVDLSEGTQTSPSLATPHLEAITLLQSTLKLKMGQLADLQSVVEAQTLQLARLEEARFAHVSEEEMAKVQQDLSNAKTQHEFAFRTQDRLLQTKDQTIQEGIAEIERLTKALANAVKIVKVENQSDTQEVEIEVMHVTTPVEGSTGHDDIVTEEAMSYANAHAEEIVSDDSDELIADEMVPYQKPRNRRKMKNKERRFPNGFPPPEGFPASSSTTSSASGLSATTESTTIDLPPTPESSPPNLKSLSDDTLIHSSLSAAAPEFNPKSDIAMTDTTTASALTPIFEDSIELPLASTLALIKPRNRRKIKNKARRFPNGFPPPDSFPPLPTETQAPLLPASYYTSSPSPTPELTAILQLPSPPFTALPPNSPFSIPKAALTSPFKFRSSSTVSTPPFHIYPTDEELTSTPSPHHPPASAGLMPWRTNARDNTYIDAVIAVSRAELLYLKEWRRGSAIENINSPTSALTPIPKSPSPSQRSPRYKSRKSPLSASFGKVVMRPLPSPSKKGLGMSVWGKGSRELVEGEGEERAGMKSKWARRDVERYEADVRNKALIPREGSKDVEVGVFDGEGSGSGRGKRESRVVVGDLRMRSVFGGSF